MVTTLGAETHCPGNVASVPFRVVNRQIIVVVSVNRSGPYNFLLDTGSQVTIVDPLLAGELHLTADRARGPFRRAGMSRADDSVRPD